MSEKLMGWINNLAEPKRLNRFELLMTDELRLTCHKVSIPGIKIAEVPIDRMHEIYYVAGSKVTYDAVKLEFYDFIDNQASKALHAWYSTIYDRGSSLMGYPANYKQDLTLLVYGPDHSVVESWLLVGAWPTDLAYGELDWKSGDGVRNVSVNLRIDQAKLTLS